MALRTLQRHLTILQTIFTNALTNDSPFAQQPEHIITPLRIHQLAVIEAMRLKEEKLQKGLLVPRAGGEEVLYSNYAVLGDRVGVGKTLMTLGHISQMIDKPKLKHITLHDASTSHFYSLFHSEQAAHMFSNLIIVPHTLFRQWQDAITSQTTLTAFFCKTQRELDKPDFIEKIQNSHVTLISNTLFTFFYNHLTFRLGGVEPCWERIFYDEVDSLKISSTCSSPKANMTWFISATYSNILFSNEVCHSYSIRQLPEETLQRCHPELKTLLQEQVDSHPTVLYYKMLSHPFFARHVQSEHPLRGNLVVLCDKTFLETSVQLPPLHRRTIVCEAPMQHQFIANVLPAEVAIMLHAGDTEGALQALGVSSHTPLTIVDAVTGYKQKELDRLKRLFDFKKEEEYATPQAKEQALKSLEDRMKRLEEQILQIKERIAEASKDSCSICYESGNNPLLTPCCSKIFCAQCILEWMTRVPACPLCRHKFHPSELVNLSTSNVRNVEQPHREKLKKLDALMKIFEECPDGRFLVFSRYENPFHDIELGIEGKYSFGYVQGNKDVIAHTLERFETGRLKILFLNSRTASAGMNIASATHLILLHKMGNEEEKQILGRAYRLGRTQPLEYISLLHEHE
jgi:hypothetical protein